jgi:hypothetical protein
MLCIALPTLKLTDSSPLYRSSAANAFILPAWKVGCPNVTVWLAPGSARHISRSLGRIFCSSIPINYKRTSRGQATHISVFIIAGRRRLPFVPPLDILIGRDEAFGAQLASAHLSKCCVLNVKPDPPFGANEQMLLDVGQLWLGKPTERVKLKRLDGGVSQTYVLSWPQH